MILYQWIHRTIFFCYKYVYVYRKIVISYRFHFFSGTPFKTLQNDPQGHKIVLDRESSIDKITQAVHVVEGANLIRNEYGSPLFANFFFFITGFHGFHVFTGVLINLIIFFNVVIGTYEKRGHYEMVEKVGLYWHFVDLVWVFVFTFFYLV